MTRRANSLMTLAVIAAVAAGGSYRVAAQQAAVPAADPVVMRSLLQAEPGTYTVAGGKLAPADPKAEIPAFVQADALRPSDGPGVRVPLAIGVGASAPWVMQVQVTAPGWEPAASQPIALTFAGTGGVARDSGELMLAPGEYDLTVAVAARNDGRQWLGTTRRQHLTVPNLSGGLAASPVVLGEKAAASNPADSGRPFVYGPTAITPAPLNRFRQSDRIHVGLRINGWKADALAKPDVTVEYVFEQQFKEALRFFNKTKPQALNASTLAKTFDGRDGELATGMTIPLAAFPPGEFQLVVRVKDKRTQATTTQKTTFVIQS
jgi:hypothetical protein